ncbi:hypothetical protein glysoja_035008, partial [Glycine soja]
LNCINLTRTFRFKISHIYKEAHTCAHNLASFGAQLLGYTWWDNPPSFIAQELLRDRLGLPSYR